jgi:hypothetical protein
VWYGTAGDGFDALFAKGGCGAFDTRGKCGAAQWRGEFLIDGKRGEHKKIILFVRARVGTDVSNYCVCLVV